MSKKPTGTLCTINKRSGRSVEKVGYEMLTPDQLETGQKIAVKVDKKTIIMRVEAVTTTVSCVPV